MVRWCCLEWKDTSKWLVFLICDRFMWHQRRQWQPTAILLPGKSHGWRSLEGCSPWGRQESRQDTTERLHFHFSLSCIGEGNGYPLQCSCLENPRGEGAWWAAVYGVAQSRTRLKWLSSSSRWWQSDFALSFCRKDLFVKWSWKIEYWVGDRQAFRLFVKTLGVLHGSCRVCPVWDK